jgi:hypothetical protein
VEMSDASNGVGGVGHECHDKLWCNINARRRHSHAKLTARKIYCLIYIICPKILADAPKIEVIMPKIAAEFFVKSALYVGSSGCPT